MIYRLESTCGLADGAIPAHSGRLAVQAFPVAWTILSLEISKCANYAWFSPSRPRRSRPLPLLNKRAPTKYSKRQEPAEKAVGTTFTLTRPDGGCTSRAGRRARSRPLPQRLNCRPFRHV